jgi:dTDP-4-dehydrorhamnose reductase
VDRPVVVLGSTGMLGQALLREAARRGRPCVGLSRRGGVDLARVPSIDEVLDPLQPALLVNAAAMTNLEECESRPDDAYMINARLPGLLAAWCSRHSVPWVQVSTDHYHAGTQNTLHDEAAPLQLLNQYARGKFAGETFAARSAWSLILRTNLVGFRGWPGRPTFVEWAIAALQKSQPFTTYEDVWASSIEVGQFAQALFDLADVGARGLVNLAARESVSKASFILALARAFDLDARCCRIRQRPTQGQPPRANTMGLVVTRAEALLGRRLPTTTAVMEALALAFNEREHAQA